MPDEWWAVTWYRTDGEGREDLEGLFPTQYAAEQYMERLQAIQDEADGYRDYRAGYTITHYKKVDE